MTKVGGDILAVRADIEEALGAGYDELHAVTEHDELQAVLRNDCFDLPGALADLVRDYATRTEQPLERVMMGKDPDGWTVQVRLLDAGEDTSLRLMLHKNVLPWLCAGRHNALVTLGVGSGLSGGEIDESHLWQLKRHERYRPYLTSAAYADKVLENVPTGQKLEVSRTLVWPYRHDRERALRGYLWSVIEGGRAVLNATERLYV